MFNLYQIHPFHYFSPSYNLQSYFLHQIYDQFNDSNRNIQISNTHFVQNQISSAKIQQNPFSFIEKPQDQYIQTHLDVKSRKDFKICKTKSIEKQIKRKRKSTEQITKIQRNQTKNISKNFGKAILAFAKTNSKFSQQLLRKLGVDRQYLISYIKKARKDLNSLQDLRQMWGADNKNDKLKKCLRIISYNFMRKHCLSYIFNSRIKSVGAHTKYRHRLMDGLTNPGQFMNIKQN